MDDVRVRSDRVCFIMETCHMMDMPNIREFDSQSVLSAPLGKFKSHD